MRISNSQIFFDHFAIALHVKQTQKSIHKYEMTYCLDYSQSIVKGTASIQVEVTSHFVYKKAYLMPDILCHYKRRD